MRREMIAIGGVALILRVLLVITTPHSGLIYDPADYEVHAASIAAGHGYPATQIATPGTPSAFRPPAYPYLLGAVYAVLGIHPNVGRLVGALLGTLTVLLIAALGIGLWGRRVGLTAGAVAAVCPSLIVLNGSLLSESLFLPCELGLALTLLTIVRSGPTIRRTLLAGALCALAASTRTVGILLLIPTVIAVCSARAGWGTRLRASGAVLAACILVLLPWTIRNAETFHAFVFLDTQGGLTLAGQYNAEAGRDDGMQAIWRDFPSETPDLARKLAPLYRRPGGINEVQLDHTLTDDAVSYIGHHPSELFIASLFDGLRMWGIGRGHSYITNLTWDEMNVPQSLRTLTLVGVWLLTIIALLGLAARATRRLPVPRLGPIVVWLIPLITVLGTVPANGSPRYRVIVDPFLILLATATVMPAPLRRRPAALRTTAPPR